MNLFGFWKRQSLEPPMEVIQAACDLYGVTPEDVPAIRTERLKALADNLWVVKLNEKKSAVVAYVPEEDEGHTITAPWYGE